MQRQDDYQLTRHAMLLFIGQLLSLAGLFVRIVAERRPIEDRLLWSVYRSEHTMLNLVAGIVNNVDTRSLAAEIRHAQPPDPADFDIFARPADRQAELLRAAASLKQIAVMLALLLAMNPRAFRDRMRAPGHQPLSDLHIERRPVLVDRSQCDAPSSQSVIRVRAPP